MLRKTFFATTFLLIGAAALQYQVGLFGQTSPSLVKLEAVSNVKVTPLDLAGGFHFPYEEAKKPYLDVIGERLAVDETGDLYLAFAIRMIALPEQPREEPKLVKYDRTGRMISAFALPEFLFTLPGESVYLYSVSIFQDKVYVPSSWRDKENRIRGSILVYTKDGRYERSIDTLIWFVPQKVVVLPTGEFFVVGSGRHVSPNMILKLSPTGQVLSSFSPFPPDPPVTEDVKRRMWQNHLLVDSAGRLIHVLPDATIRVFNLDGRWLKTIPPAIPASDDVTYSVFLRDDVFVFTTVDVVGQRRHLTVMDQEGRVISQTDIVKGPSIRVEGKDGSYYAILHEPSQAVNDPFKLEIRKMRLELPK
jgi:hypothetical protein